MIHVARLLNHRFLQTRKPQDERRTARTYISRPTLTPEGQVEHDVSGPIRSTICNIDTIAVHRWR
jgi:hypothetical protein